MRDLQPTQNLRVFSPSRQINVQALAPLKRRSMSRAGFMLKLEKSTEERSESQRLFSHPLLFGVAVEIELPPCIGQNIGWKSV